MLIEQVIRDWLAQQLGTTAVYLEVPERKPTGDYVVVERTAGSVNQHINRATFALQSVSPVSLYRAAELSQRVTAAALRLPECLNISRAELNSEYNFTNPKTKEYRYQAVIDLVYMQ